MEASRCRRSSKKHNLEGGGNVGTPFQPKLLFSTALMPSMVNSS